MRKKGFTLVELLAVIVILAIIIVLAVPKVLDIIEKVEMESYRESVELMAYTAQVQYQNNEALGNVQQLPITYEYGYSESKKEGIQTNQDIVGLLNFKGDKPRSGNITLTINQKVIVNNLVSKNGKWCAIKDENTKVSVGKTTEFGCEIETSDLITEDKNPCELEIDNNDSNILYVDSVGDLYALSKSVNSGNTYSGKTIKLRNNLDMSEKLPNTTVCNTMDTTFMPIGKLSNTFNGTFDGGAKTIDNLIINLPNQEYVGLFGLVTSATIKGFNIKNANITGLNSVGAAVGGSNSSTIQEIVVDNSKITGNNYVGGIMGINGKNNINLIIKNSSITASNIGGYIKGDINATTINSSFVYNTQITASRIQDVDVTYFDRANPSAATNYYSNTCKKNNIQVSNGMDSSYFSDINYFETLGLDTYIAGDDDSSGYYFDYDSSDQIVLKSTTTSPIKFTLSGSGTSTDPYIIDNYEHWKEATSKADLENIVFKLTSDLDFNNNKFYMMGSFFNQFKGTFDGGAKTIKNVNINSTYFSGIFGMISNSSIYGLNLININVNGIKWVGSLLGTNSSSNIYEILVKNSNISGEYSVGGLSGTSYGRVSNIIIANTNVSASDNFAGPFKGDFGASQFLNSMVTSTNISSRQKTDFPSATNYSNDCKFNNIQLSGGFNSIYIDKLYYYKGKVETSLDGDNNNSGYFFDDPNDEIMVVPAYTITTSNSLSSEDPYVYTNTSETDQTAPTCVLNEMIILNNGFRPKVTCTDNVKIESFRSYFDSTTSKAAQTYEQIGNSKSNITKSNTEIIYNGTWATTNKTGPYPTKGTCYYFRYGARDAAGNYSTYVTKDCYKF